MAKAQQNIQWIPIIIFSERSRPTNDVVYFSHSDYLLLFQDDKKVNFLQPLINQLQPN